MKKIACLYFEGNDSKITLFEHENNKLKIIKAASIESSQAFLTKQNPRNPDSGAEESILFYDTVSDESQAYNNSYLQKLNNFLKDQNLKEYEFMPILTEPGIYFQKIDSEKDYAAINKSKEGKKQDKNKTLSFIELSDNSKLAVYPSGQINYLQALDSLSKLNGMRFLKIASVKCAETALVNYVVNTDQLSQDSTSLIIYFGKEYTKLIFLKGEKLIHLGATISVGKNHGKISNVVISKILYEREHAQLDVPDNIFIFGEKVSEEFNERLKESYQSSRINQFIINHSFISVESTFNTSELSIYSVPIAAAHEQISVFNKKLISIDLLPSYIKEQQKQFQLAWHGILLILAMFASVLFLTYSIFLNEFELDSMDNEIQSLLAIQRQNQETVQRIAQLNEKINSAEQTRVFLDQISSGSGQWVFHMEKLADFTNDYRNLWIKTLNIDKTNPLLISGYSTQRYILPEFKRQYSGSILEFMHYEPMRDRNVYEFNIKVISSKKVNNEPEK